MRLQVELRDEGIFSRAPIELASHRGIKGCYERQQSRKLQNNILNIAKTVAKPPHEMKDILFHDIFLTDVLPVDDPFADAGFFLRLALFLRADSAARGLLGV